MIAIVIHLCCCCGGGGNKLSTVRIFIILLLGEGLTSSNKNTCANFSVKKSVIKFSKDSVFCEKVKKLHYLQF